MITNEQIPNLLGKTAYDKSHNKLGKVGQVYVDDRTGRLEWMTIRTGLFGAKETFVPTEPAEIRGDEVVVPFEKGQIQDAPTVDTEAGGHLSEDEEGKLYSYYATKQAPSRSSQPPPGAVGRDTSGPTTDEAMTRSEEQLHVGTESRESGRARLRKYVVTEEEQHTVPVRKEKVRVEREPITDENRDRAMAGPDISEEEHEVVLHEERPVVAKETAPVERVKLAKETVTEEQTVSGQVRKERIDTEGLPEER